MPDENSIKNTNEEYPEFTSLEKFSPEIVDICAEQGVEDREKIEGIAYRIAWVLLNQLPKENLAFAIEHGLGVDYETSKKISDEANKRIFSAQPPTPPVPVKKDTYREQVS